VKKTKYQSGLFALLISSAFASPAWAQSESRSQMNATISVKTEEAVVSLLPWVEATVLFNRATLGDSGGDPVIKNLKTKSQDTSRSFEQRTKSLRLASLVAWKSGDLKQALEIAAQAASLQASADNLYLLAQVSDASGQISEAVSAYKSALEASPSGAMAAEIRLQLALIEAMNNDVDAYLRFVNTTDPVRKNRAAITLALMRYPGEALSLYTPIKGNGKAAVAGHMRMAGWAIQVEDLDKAKVHAWKAVSLAVEKRERLYGLGLLVEAHRMDDSLDDLIKTFSTSKKLGIEAREVWINLLHETGRATEAMALFRSNSSGDFTPEERIKLIGLYQSGGDDLAIIGEYQKLIKAEPNEIYWYIGLSEHYAIKGLDRDARQVWLDFLKTDLGADVLLGGAEAMTEMGFYADAVNAAELAIKRSRSPVEGLTFLFEHYLGREKTAEAKSMLGKLDQYFPPDSVQRYALADSYERIGEPAIALQIWETLLDTPGLFGVDETMRLAWLYRSLERDEDALAIWKRLQKEQLSPALRGIVEQQLLTLSAELGILGDLVFELEDSLSAGTASKNDSAFLARIYIRVEDKVSAIEIIDEFFKRTGGAETEALKEQAKVYLLMSDFVNYGKTSERLMEVDPKNKTDYLRDIILSKVELLENVGDSDNNLAELRKKLKEFRAQDTQGAGRQFEGGVLVLAGQDEDAIKAFLQAIAETPNNGDYYLQLGSILAKLGREEEAFGLFQALLMETENEEMFVSAIDGVMNTFSPANSGGVLSKRGDAMLGWLQRAIYARLIRKDDEFYYYQLLSDVISETGDSKAEVAILENSLATAEDRRMSILRELISMTAADEDAGPTFGGAQKTADKNAQNKFGRRLVGLQQALPPGIYMSLATAFIANEDPYSSEKAVNKAVEESGQTKLRADAGAMFEKHGYDLRAINQYRRALIRDRKNFSLMINVARLREKVGQDQGANELFGQSLEILLLRQKQTIRVVPEVTVKDRGSFTEIVYNDTSKTLEYKAYYASILQGFMTTWQDDPSVMKDWLDRFENLVMEELKFAISEMGDRQDPMEKYSRLRHLGIFLRSVSLAIGDYDRADRIDTKLLQQFSYDDDFIFTLLKIRLDRGFQKSAVRLAAHAGKTEAGLGVRSARLLTSRIENRTDTFAQKLALAKETKDFDAVLNMAFASGDDSRLLLTLRAWAQAGFFLESFKWSKDNLDRENHKNLSRYLVQLIRKKRSFFFVAAGQDGTFFPELEQSAGEFVFSNRELLILMEEDRVGIEALIKQFVTGYVLERLSSNMKLQYFETSLRDRGKDQSALSVLAPFWVNFVETPQEKAMAARFAKMTMDIFAEAPLRGDEGYMSGVLMSFSDTLFTFEGTLYQAKVASENRVWVKKVMDNWRELTSTEFDFFRPVDLLLSGQPDVAVDAAIDMFLAVMETSEGDSGVVAPYTLHSKKYFFPKYKDAMKANILAREKNDGPSEALAELYSLLFFSDTVTIDSEQENFLRQKSKQFPTNPKYLGQLKKAIDKTELPWWSIDKLRKLLENEPKNAMYRGALFLELIRADRIVEAMALNGRGTNDMLSEGYFDNLKNIAKKQGFVFEHDEFSRFAGRPTGFSTGVLAHMATDPAKKPVNIISLKLAEAIIAEDQNEMRKQLRTLWQTVMKNKREVWMPLDQYEIEKLGKYIEIINLDWPEKADPKHRDRKLFDVISDYEFSLKEFESFIRAKKIDGKSGLNALYQYLIKTYEKQGLAEAKFEELSKEIRAEGGNVGQDEFILWLNFSEQMKAVPSKFLLKDLEGWYAGRANLSSDILRLLARLYARAGQQDKSLDVYKTLADQSLFMRFPRLEFTYQIEFLYIHQGQLSARELVAEGVQNLESAQRQKLLDYILARASGLAGRDHRLRQMADLLIFESLRLSLPAEKLTARLDKLDVETAEEYPVNALALTALYVKAGQTEQASKQLKTMVRLFSELRVKAITELESHVHTGNERAGKIGQTFAELVGYPISYLTEIDPVILSDVYTGALASEDDQNWPWLVRVGDELSSMLNEPKMDRQMVVDMMVDIGRRLYKGGKTKDAKRILDQLSQASKSKAFNGIMVENMVSLAREAEIPLDIENAKWLLKNRQLDKVAIIETVERVRKTENVDEALKLAEAAARYTRFDGLLGTLVDLSKSAGMNERADKWAQERADSARHRGRLQTVLATASQIPIHKRQ